MKFGERVCRGQESCCACFTGSEMKSWGSEECGSQFSRTLDFSLGKIAEQYELRPHVIELGLWILKKSKLKVVPGLGKGR